MSDITGDWPVIVDDSGSGTDGTVINKAVTDTMLAAVNGQVYDAANPLITPADIIGEVVDARGAKASLDDRLSTVIDANGNLIATPDIAGALGAVNLLANAEFLLWPNGDTSPPAYFSSQSFTTYQRCGTGLADTNTKVGDFCCRVTASAGGEAHGLYRLATTGTILSTFLQGRTVSLGAWVLATVPGVVRLVVSDGIDTSNSDYHSGSGWEWLSVTHAINAAGHTHDAYLSVAASNVGYISGPTYVLSGTAPTTYSPAPLIHERATVFIAGAQTVSDDKVLIPMHRNGIVRNVYVSAATAPTGQALKVDVLKGRAGTALFTSGGRPAIADGAFSGSAAPDGATYSARCFASGTLLSACVKQIGSGAAGSDLFLSIEYLTYMRPLEALLPYNA